MKTLFLSLILFASQSFAQITLTGANNPAAGDISSSTDCDTVNINQGNSGANQTWSFLNLSRIDSSTSSFVNASTTPFASQFPTSNIASTFDASDYSYFTTSSSSFISNGLGSAALSIIYSDPQTYMQYPFSFNSNFSDNFAANYTSGSFQVFSTGTTTVTGDAWGTISLPFGNFSNALRVKAVTTTNDSSTLGTSTSSITSYSWYVNGRKFPVFTISYIYFSFNGFPLGSSKNVTYSSTESVGISNISSEIPDGYTLSQNYPNPFNPVTNLEFGISKLEFVSLKIYDMLGKEVATLVNSELKPGVYRYNFDASGLTSGIYFYKLNAGEFSETKRMNLIK